jgi:hypothetical protein
MEGIQVLKDNPLTGTAIKALVGVLVIAALYYLFKYLTSPSMITSTVLFGGPISADTRSNPAPAYGVNSLPALYEGGEFAVSFWMYLNDFSYRKGYEKHVFEISGTTFATLLVTVGANSNNLQIRVHTADTPTGNNALPIAEVTRRVSTLQPSSMVQTGTEICDLPNFDMQKWVLITVVLSGRMCDVYMDGKLARSCTLPNFYKVDTGYSLKPLLAGGYGGYISNMTAYGYALNPDEVYRVYMAGPNASKSLGDWFKSFFDPQSGTTFDYPKMNGQ